jgi:hypothetical protein
MKFLANSIIATLFLFLAASSFAGPRSYEQLIIKLGVQIHGRTTEVVCDEKSGRISLRISEQLTSKEPTLEALKKQVEILTSEPGKRTKIASEYVLVYDGGYPIYDPYYEIGRKGAYTYLTFSEKVRVEGKEIHFKGELTKINRKYPYKNP